MKNLPLESRTHFFLLLILTLMGYFFLMMGNGLLTLTHPDEVFYAQTAKEMIEHDTWLIPHIFGVPQFEKPILFYALLAWVMKLFGNGPFVARFWPAFFGIIGILATYGIAFVCFKKKRPAFLSGVVLSTSFIYMALSRAILTDMVFSVLVIIALGFFYFAYRFKEQKHWGILLCFFFSALAVLTKGLLGFCFPFGAILLFLAFKKDLKFLICKPTLIGGFLFVLITFPWHLYMLHLYGQEFVTEYWHNVHVRRLFVAEHPRCNTWYFYPGLFFAGVMPWTPFLIFGLFFLFRYLRQSGAHREVILFLSCWVLSIFLFVQPAASKLASYIFPVYPALAIFIGFYWDNIMNHHPLIQTKILKIGGMIYAAILLAGSFVGVFFARQYQHIIPHMVPVYVIATILAGGSIAAAVFIIKGKWPVVFTHIALISAILLLTLFMGIPYAEPWVSCHMICDRLKAVDTSRSVLLSSKFYARGVKYYTDRPVAVIDIDGKEFFSPHPIPFLSKSDKVLNFLNQQNTTYGIVKIANVKDLERILQGQPFQFDVLESLGGKYLVRIKRIKSQNP